MEHSLGKQMFRSLMPLISHVTDEGLREFYFYAMFLGVLESDSEMNKEKGI